MTRTSGGASTITCRHCGMARADDDAIPTLCVECADLAVWGGACADCDTVPTGRERESDRALALAGRNRLDNPRAEYMS